MSKFIKNQITYFLFGLGFWLPIAVLILILIFVFNSVEDIGRKMLLSFIPEKYLYPGLGIVFGLLFMYISGIILKLTRIRQVFSKIPFIGLLFGAGEIITIDQLLHLNPCIFALSPTCLAYGWILSEEKVRLKEGESDINLINVYYPNVPALITGQVYPVRKNNIIRIGNSSKEIIDILLYAFRSPKYLIYLPWENESEEAFEKRASSLGININTRELAQ